MHGAPSELDREAVARFCVAIDRLRIDRYLRERWTPQPERLEGILAQLRALKGAMEEAEAAIDAYEAAHDDYDERRASRLDPINEQLAHVRDKKFVLPAVEVPVDYSGDRAEHWTGKPVRFESGEEGPRVVAGAVTIGPVAYGRGDDGVAEEAVAPLDPEHLRGDVSRASRSGETLYVRIDVGATRRRMEAARRRILSELSAPEAPAPLVHVLASDAFARGYERLTRLLQSKQAPADQAA
jgi:hypothetical protein